MEMFALIKKGDKLKIVKSRDIEKKADFLAKDFIGNFLDDIIASNGKDYVITLDDLDLINYDEDEFGEYVTDNIISKLIVKRRKNELNRLFEDLLNYYNLDSDLINDIIRYSFIDKHFYVDIDGSIFYDKRYVVSTFNSYFGFLMSEALIKKLDSMIESKQYSLNYKAGEFKDYIFENNKIIKADRKNFEYLLYLMGEISNPKVPSSVRHRCYNCANLSPLSCKKAEYYKKKISGYSFINEGYQIFMTTDYRDLHMTSFIVEDCDNYMISSDKTIDEEEYSYVKKIRK